MKKLFKLSMHGLSCSLKQDLRPFSEFKFLKVEFWIMLQIRNVTLSSSVFHFIICSPQNPQDYFDQVNMVYLNKVFKLNYKKQQSYTCVASFDSMSFLALTMSIYLLCSSTTTSSRLVILVSFCSSCFFTSAI